MKSKIERVNTAIFYMVAAPWVFVALIAVYLAPFAACVVLMRVLDGGG